MLLNEKTKTRFGYDAISLSKFSRKRIVSGCDYCKQDYETTMKIYSTGRDKFPSNTGYEQGMNKIWDCGQAKWVK